MSENPPPKRRHRLVLDLHADSLEELTRSLLGVVRRFDEGPVSIITSGGCSSGFHMVHTEDVDMSPKRYRDALDAWRDRKAAS